MTEPRPREPFPGECVLIAVLGLVLLVVAEVFY